MTMFDLSMEIKSQLNRERLMEQAGAHRLYRSTLSRPTNLQKRLLLGAGDTLIALGSKLKARGRAGSVTPLLRAG
jgi:hypothetical protein